ncbi:MAG: OmpA family protein [Imperialibacter sp.]|uniref:OmpA family protein n=1 Tax=Imperialibacter sp. TaxID=2038411 RepID=UPI0032ED51BD
MIATSFRKWAATATLLCAGMFTLKAQQVQWASSVVGFSSEYINNNYKGQYLAKEILGKPSRYPVFGATPCGWTPGKENSPEGEWIKVGFDKPMQISQVAVVEIFNPGAVSRILLYDEADNESVIYQNDSTAPLSEAGRLLSHVFPKTTYKVAAVKVELRTASVPGFNELDAIAISDSEVPVRAGINLSPDADKALQIEHLSTSVNTPTDELNPIISPDGKVLYFTREGHPENLDDPATQDIWFANINEDGSLETAVNIGRPLNNASNSGLESILPDNQTALLLNTYNADGTMGVGVSITHKEGDKWGFPEKVEIDSFYNRSKFGEYFLMADGQTLLMTLQRDNSIGAKDIHVSFKKEDGTWSAPMNIGPTVNTAASEIFPYMAADGVSLYYSTAGWPGYGSSDMFVTRRLDDSWLNWSEPQNLGPHINSPQFDAYYSFTASGDYAYFSSYGNDSYGKSDLYRVRLPESLRPKPVVVVRGRVLNAKTNEPLGASINYEVLSSGKQAGVANSDATDGSYSIILPSGENYGFLGQSDGFISVSENLDLVNLKEYREINKDLYLVPIEKGQVVRLNNIFFDVDKFTFKKEATPELNRFVKLLTDQSGLRIEISGHTDNTGSADYNMKLSANRAKAVYDYLVKQGIDAGRLAFKGYGLTKPTADNNTADGRQLNRRVEFLIVESE